MDKKIVITGGLFGLVAVILGAFAAHGLKPKIDPSALESFQTGVRYQMYHALLLLITGISASVKTNYKKYIYYFIMMGVFLFSGSIYLLATNVLTEFDFKIIGFITPIGGLFLILAWLFLILNFIKIKQE